MDKTMTEREAFEAWWAENHSKPFNHKQSAIELWKVAYAKGAEDMREQAKRACKALENNDHDWDNEDWNQAVERCHSLISALPFTPTNTKGEQE